MRVLVIPVFFLAAACAEDRSATLRPSSQPTAPSHAPTRTESLGELVSSAEFELIADGVREGPALAVEDVLAAPASYAGENALRLAGEIVSVCPKKGRWLRMGTADHNLLVKFGQRDRYVPLDAKGRQVLVEGKLLIEQVSVAEQKHLLEDQGKAAEAAAVLEPKKQVRFAATGAAIHK